MFGRGQRAGAFFGAALVATQVVAEFFRACLPVGGEIAVGGDGHGHGMGDDDARQPQRGPVGRVGRVDGQQVEAPCMAGQGGQQGIERAGILEHDRAGLGLRGNEQRPAAEAERAHDQRAVDRAGGAVGVAMQAKQLAAIAKVLEQRADEAAVEEGVAAIQPGIEPVPVGGVGGEALAGGVELPGHWVVWVSAPSCQRRFFAGSGRMLRQA